MNKEKAHYRKDNLLKELKSGMQRHCSEPKNRKKTRACYCGAVHFQACLCIKPVTEEKIQTIQ